MASYVVTGGGGFIGSHIVEELLRRRESVKVIDNFSTGKRENAPSLSESDISKAVYIRFIFLRLPEFLFILRINECDSPLPSGGSPLGNA